MRRVRLISIGMLLVFSLAAVSSARSEGLEDQGPFGPGEKLTFQLTGLFIPVGQAVLEIMPIASINGEAAYHFVMTASTNATVDTFYMVRDRIDAYTDLGVTRSLLYEKDQQEGSTRRKIVVNFDWEKGEARYANFGKTREPITVQPGTLDPLSVLFFVRMSFLEEGLEVAHPVTDGRKCIVGRSKVVRRETIKVAEKTYDTLVVEPSIERIGGVFEKSKNARIEVWMTADRRHLPVRVKSRVVVGSFVAELVGVEGWPPIAAPRGAGM